MDYITRQFINLTKKFRKELPKSVEVLHKSIDKHSEAIKAASKRAEQNHAIPPLWLDEVISKYQEPVGTKKTSDERQYRIQVSLARAAWFAFIAAAIYGAIAFLQWHALNTQNINQSTANINSGVTADRTLAQVQKTVDDTHRLADAAQRQAKAAEGTLVETTKNFRIDERAWIGLVRFEPNDPKAFPFPIESKYLWKNYGKTPALQVLIHDEAYVFGDDFPSSPPYDQEPAKTEKRSNGTVFPDQANESTATAYRCTYYTKEIAGGTKWCYTYGYFTYNDQFGTGHTTHFCYRHGLVFPGHFGTRLCNKYNDAN